jgi:hypothetical protein
MFTTNPGLISRLRCIPVWVTIMPSLVVGWSLRQGWCWGGYLYFLLRWDWWISLILHFFLIHCLVVCKRPLYVEVGCLRCWFYTIWSQSSFVIVSVVDHEQSSINKLISHVIWIWHICRR